MLLKDVSVALDAYLQVFKLNKEFWLSVGKNGLILELIMFAKACKS